MLNHNIIRLYIVVKDVYYVDILMPILILAEPILHSVLTTY